jgi:hypothetical protein
VCRDIVAFSGFLGWWAGWAAEGLVVAVGVEGEFSDEFTGFGGDHADVEVGDQDQDAGAGVFAA